MRPFGRKNAPFRRKIALLMEFCLQNSMMRPNWSVEIDFRNRPESPTVPCMIMNDIIIFATDRVRHVPHSVSVTFFDTAAKKWIPNVIMKPLFRVPPATDRVRHMPHSVSVTFFDTLAKKWIPLVIMKPLLAFASKIDDFWSQNPYFSPFWRKIAKIAMY